MADIGLDASLRLFADRERRRIVQRLRHGADEVTPFAELLDRLAAGGRAAGEDPPVDRDRLAAELHHVHLPTLAAHGVVDVDPRRGTVRYRPDRQIEQLLDAFPAVGSKADVSSGSPSARYRS